jgi:hypothetical protein
MTVFLSPLAGAGQQFLDNSGDPLTGGLLYTYAAGTTTPETTYTTALGTTAHANPIVMDAAGRLESEVWLTGEVAYKFILRDSAGGLIGTYDDIYGINDVSATGVPWAEVTGTPTTLAGYGITDSITAAVAASTYAPINDAALTGTTTIQDAAAASHRAGYLDVPQNANAASYDLVLADRGKSVVMNGTSLTLTIPANGTVAFPIGTAIVVININATALSVAITTDTMTLVNTTTTGTRTLAQNAMATLVKVGATSWIIAGLGVT